MKLLFGVLLALLAPTWASAEGISFGDTPVYRYQAGVTADTLVKTGPGVVHTVTCASDAAATAGTVAIRDATAAGAGTIIQTIEFVAAFFPPVTITLDVAFKTGLFLDFTTTADVMCSASFR